MPDFGLVIRRLRANLHLSISGLAERVGLTHTTIRRAEHSKVCTFQGDNLTRVLRGLGVGYGQLIRLMAAEWDGTGRSWMRYQLFCLMGDLPPQGQSELYAAALALSQKYDVPMADELPTASSTIEPSIAAGAKARIARGADDASMLVVEEDDPESTTGGKRSRVKHVVVYHKKQIDLDPEEPAAAAKASKKPAHAHGTAKRKRA